MKDCIADAVMEEAGPLEVRRPAQGTYDEHGRWQVQDAATLTIQGAAQPLRPDEILRLPDSRHIQGAIKIYTADELRTVSVVDKRQPDKVVYRNVEYEVESVGNWESFYKVIAIRREQ